MHPHREEEIDRSSDIHHYDTRSRNLLRPPTIRLHTSEYLRRGVAMYNQCPDAWKNANTPTFKKLVRNHLLNLAPYTKEEIHCRNVL